MVYERILEYLQPVLPQENQNNFIQKTYQAVDKQQHKVYDQSKTLPIQTIQVWYDTF